MPDAATAFVPERPGARPGPGWSVPALLIGIGVAVTVTIYPRAVTRPDGAPDMLAAALLFVAMSAGFVRGTGFVPRNLVGRLGLSLPVSLLALAAAVVRLMPL
ncbi:cyd operon YbgE family protein [Rhodoplanes sp. TEM]|uniref:Cyd operon YbgE family protein n=1 Tax=Rhodoplanes tepidamans TaxID=200616 RepID=A0ABT5JDH3_RHOTP|nr:MULTISPECIES: cyd operon YbgE family protein [Rhodoplanes]MDC7787677.1 cyd operon YbgE family protein [Rhodoplanes tepidamans]MDC7983051.1 cyd operon YbgE family protein [Rhodoplanes sp. TEM]MDQ0356433.1 putative membrane protein [Rhodoplanes tepidamans]